MLYLASKSPRRKKILNEFKIPFKVIAPKSMEITVHSRPITSVLINSENKAKSVIKKVPSNSKILASDTIVFFHDHIYGKAKSRIEAEETLRILSGKTHLVITGLCLINLKTDTVYLDYAITRISFRKNSQETISKYLDSIKFLDKAGGYAIQDQKNIIVDRIDGSFTNVVGLPTEKLSKLLTHLDQ